MLSSEATNRIAIVYHSQAARNRSKEWQVRLSGVDLTEQDIERVRLITVHDMLEVQIKAAETLAILEAIDVESDAIWAP